MTQNGEYKSIGFKVRQKLVKLIGIFLLIYSIITIVQGFYGLRVSFRQGQFGFRYEMLKDPSAMLITGIVEGFPAHRAGLKPGDRILQVNGQSLDPRNMLTLWGDAVAGSQLVLTVQRENQIMEMQLTRKLLPMIDRVIRVLFHLILPALMLAYILVGLWGVFKHSSFITNLIALVCFFFGTMISSVTLSAVSSPLTEIFNYYQIKEIVTMICSLLAILLGFGCLYSYLFWLSGFPAYVGWIVFFIFLVTQVVGLIVPFTFLNSVFQNEILVIYTDGIEEFFNYQLEAFGAERMIKTFKENKRLHPQEIIQKLFKELNNFAGKKESYHCDDLTIIVVKRID